MRGFDGLARWPRSWPSTCGHAARSPAAGLRMHLDWVAIAGNGRRALEGRAFRGRPLDRAGIATSAGVAGPDRARGLLEGRDRSRAGLPRGAPRRPLLAAPGSFELRAAGRLSRTTISTPVGKPLVERRGAVGRASAAATRARIALTEQSTPSCEPSPAGGRRYTGCRFGDARAAAIPICASSRSMAATYLHREQVTTAVASFRGRGARGLGVGAATGADHPHRPLPIRVGFSRHCSGC
jgi:hypothetical protein